MHMHVYTYMCMCVCVCVSVSILFYCFTYDAYVCARVQTLKLHAQRYK